MAALAQPAPLRLFFRVRFLVANVFSYLELYWLMARIARGIGTNRLKETIELCTRVRPNARSAPRSEAELAALVAHTDRLTRSVARWHLLPNSCLHRGLLPCWYLARRGVKADFIIAVRNYPFAAHAWAEWRDVKLGDPVPAWLSPETFLPVMRV